MLNKFNEFKKALTIMVNNEIKNAGYNIGS